MCDLYVPDATRSVCMYVCVCVRARRGAYMYDGRKGKRGVKAHMCDGEGVEEGGGGGEGEGAQEHTRSNEETLTRDYIIIFT